MNYSSAAKKKNILITGAGGFIGSCVSSRLGKEYNVFNLDTKAKRPGNPRSRIAVDMSNHKKVKSYFRRFAKRRRIYAIIHMASKMASSANVKDLKLLHDNISITHGLVEMAEVLRPKKLINFSSMAVYPNKDGRFNEKFCIMPWLNNDCLYGLSKFCGENIIDFMLKGNSILISHLRIAQVYGEGMNRDRIIPAMLEELHRHNRITVFGNGRRVSSFISVERLSEILSLFLKRDLCGIFNIGEENISYLELAKRLVKQEGNRDSKIIRKPSGSRARFYLDTRKIRGILNG